MSEKCVSRSGSMNGTPVIFYTYIPENRLSILSDLSDLNPVNWNKVHINNFKRSIRTRIRSFYIKLFHKAIALNDFLYKIKRIDSPNSSFCKSAPETLHIFIDCKVVKPVWDKTIEVICQKSNGVINVSKFEKKKSVLNKILFLTYLFLLLKYYIYLCKFQTKIPNFQAFKTYIENSKDLEYRIAKK